VEDIVLGTEHDTIIEDELIQSSMSTSRAMPSPSAKEGQPASRDSSVVITQVEVKDDEDDPDDPFADDEDGSSVEEDEHGIDWSGDDDDDDDSCSDSSVEEENIHDSPYSRQIQSQRKGDDSRHEHDTLQAQKGFELPVPDLDARAQP
jgi:hypothetical protein